MNKILFYRQKQNFTQTELSEKSRQRLGFQHLLLNKIIMKTLILSLLLFIAISCNKSEEISVFPAQTITPVLIGKGIYSGSAIQSNSVIINQSNWLQLLTLLTPQNTSEFSSVNVDFDNFQLLVIIDAIRPSTGFTINITNIVENNINIIATITSINSGNGYTVFSQPFCIVKIPKSIKPVIFQ